MAGDRGRQDPYAEHQPFVRNRIDKNGYRHGPSTIDRENAILVRKLKEIKRKPAFNAPHSNSVRLGSPRDLAQAPWESFKQHTVQIPSSGQSPQKASTQEIRRLNSIFRKQLQECYAARKDSFVVQHHLGQGIDCNQRWQQRTSIYSGSNDGSTGGCKPWQACRCSSRPSSAPAAGRSSISITAAHSSRPVSAGRCTKGAAGSCTTGIPKTLGVASCAGCGTRSFFNADGVHLKPCSACKQVYYCSELCARVDQPSHKALCRYYVTGQWSPAGIRPAADCWIMNKSMAVARKLLKQQQQQHNITRPCTAPATRGVRTSNGGICTSSISKEFKRWSAVEQMDTVFEIRRAATDGWNQQLELQDRLEQQLAAVRLQEQQEERQQQQIEQRANDGMDGPRPCLCVNGAEMGDKRLYKRQLCSVHSKRI